MTDTNHDDDLLTPREAAELLGVDSKTVDGHWVPQEESRSQHDALASG